MSNNYHAISAKLKAMYSSCLRERDYDQFLTKRTVNDICSYLKNSTSYHDVLADVDEWKIHRGNMEKILNREILEQYIRLYNFMDQKQREILKFWFMRKEIDFLKHKIRYLFNQDQDEDEELQQFDEFFHKHTKIHYQDIDRARSLSEFARACEDTPYYDILVTSENIKSDFFSVGMMLDRLYYTLLWKEKEHLPQRERGVFAEFVGTSIDMLNIMWIYRGKKYFNFDNEIIYTYLIPIRYKLKEEDIKNMVEASDADKIVGILQRTKYQLLFEGIGDTYFVEENEKRLENKFARKIFVN